VECFLEEALPLETQLKPSRISEALAGRAMPRKAAYSLVELSAQFLFWFDGNGLRAIATLNPEFRPGSHTRISCSQLLHFSVEPRDPL
jgi:hypothetical protein